MKTQVRRARGGAHRCRAEEIRELTDDGHPQRASRELEEERFRLRFRAATEPLEDPLRLRVIRKDIARLKTISVSGLRRRDDAPDAGAERR